MLYQQLMYLTTVRDILMDDGQWESILKAVAPKARSDKQWAVAYATLLVANSVDKWGEGICAELARLADALGARAGVTAGEEEGEG